MVVDQIHRNLRLPATLQEQAQGSDCGQAAVALPDPSGDFPGQRRLRSGQQHIEGDQNGTGADGDGSRRRVRCRGPEIGAKPASPGIRSKKGFQTSPAKLRQGDSVRPGRGLLVEENRQIELRCYPSSEFSGQVGTFGQGQALQRNEGNHVDCPDPGVNAVVKSKIDPLNGDSARVENPFEHGSRLTGHSQNRPVMIPVRVNVQQRTSRVSPQHPSDLVDAVPVPAFADIENAFYEFHECLVPPGPAGPGPPRRPDRSDV